MRISSIHIDGFGAFSNEDIGPFQDGLNVVVGENEAGKSTLLDFVRGALYGFVDQRTPKSFHEPLRGGRHGGSITVMDEHGARWTIERIHKRPLDITTDSHQQVGESALQALVGHTDKKSFESIFAFGLDELAQADRLHEEGVRDLIFSAGVAGAGRSASLAIRQLDEERNEITRNTRTADQKNRLHQLIKDRDEISNQLRLARNKSGSYAQLLHEIDRLGSCADEAFGRYRDFQHRKDQLEDIGRAESSIRQRDELSEQLSHIRNVDDNDRRIAGELRVIDELRIRTQDHERNASEHTRQSREAFERADRIASLRERIGLAADHGDPIEITVGIRSEITGLTTSYQSAQLEIRTIQVTHTQALASLDEQRSELHRLTLNRDPSEIDIARSHLKAIPTLRTMLGQLRELDHEMELARQRDIQAAPSRFDARASVQVIFGIFVLLGITGIAIGLTHHSHGISSTTLFGSGVLVAALLSITFFRRQISAISPRDEPIDVRIQQRDALASRVADRATNLGLVAFPTDAELEELDAQLREVERDSESIRNAIRGEERATEHVRHCASELETCIDETNQLKDQAGIVSKELGLVRPVGPEALEEVTRSIDELHELLALDRRARERINELESVIERFEIEVTSLFERCGISNQGQANLVGALEELGSQCNEITLRLRAHDDLTSAIEAIDGQLNALFSRYDNAAELRQELERGSSAERELELVAVATQLEEVKDEYQILLEGRLAHQRDLDALGGSTAIADFEIALANVNSEIETVLRRWALLSLSSSLLKRTLNRYEIERQPAVIGRAAELFSHVTDGRYVSLLSREDEQQRQSLRVIRNDGTAIDAQFLSKGTAEQLYLCVRLAYAATFAERSVALPLVFDDVLVNFDPIRCAQMAQAISIVAHDHQVLLFTCHPNIVETFRSTSEALHIIELPRRV
jgi:uncharacterized protein YhaN